MAVNEEGVGAPSPLYKGQLLLTPWLRPPPITAPVYTRAASRLLLLLARRILCLALTTRLMALRFHHPTTAPVLDATDVTSFLHDLHPEFSDALLDFLSIPHVNAAVAFTTTGAPVAGDAAAFLAPTEDEFLAVEQQHCDKKLRTAFNQQQVPAVPLPEFRTEFLTFARGQDEKKPSGDNGGHSVKGAAARERRRRIRQRTAELSRLIPGGHRLSTAEMFSEAARHVKLLQAQVGMLALMHSVGSSSEVSKKWNFLSRSINQLN
jgi:hypothetical protein